MTEPTDHGKLEYGNDKINPDVVVLEKSQVVLDYFSKTDALAKYIQPEAQLHGVVIQMPLQTWIDFGSPKQLTVTIVAGDRLNKEASE